ncbi:hypothetical protein SLH32_30770 [Streptomyces sp. KHY 26]
MVGRGRPPAPAHLARLRARVMVTAWGQLDRPAWARIEGADDFAGTQAHTARRPETLDLTGKRVARVGSAAGAVRLVPAIAGTTERLTVFQRSANYLLPRQDQALGDDERAALRADPQRYAALRDGPRRTGCRRASGGTGPGRSA